MTGVDGFLGEVDNACYIGNIHGAVVSAGTFLSVIVDASGKLGTATVDANGKVTVTWSPRCESAPSHWPRSQASHARSQG